MTKVKKVSSDLKIKLVFSKKDMSLKTRGSEKVSHSKSSYCNQLIKYSMFLESLWAMINSEKRTLRASLRVAVLEVT